MFVEMLTVSTYTETIDFLSSSLVICIVVIVVIVVVVVVVVVVVSAVVVVVVVIAVVIVVLLKHEHLLQRMDHPLRRHLRLRNMLAPTPFCASGHLHAPPS